MTERQSKDVNFLENEFPSVGEMKNDPRHYVLEEAYEHTIPSSCNEHVITFTRG